MKSRHVLTIHTTTFIAFVLGSLSTPLLAIRFPQFFSSWYYYLGAVLIMVGVLGSWKVFGGCPFTVWENRLREKENIGSTYQGSCLPYYTAKWFGLKLPNKYFTGLLVFLLILPILAGII